jgi:hypothetical protein
MNFQSLNQFKTILENGKELKIKPIENRPKPALRPSVLSEAACPGLASTVAQELPRAARLRLAGPRGALGRARWP